LIGFENVKMKAKIFKMNALNVVGKGIVKLEILTGAG
jgi:hypothetical protein